MRILFIGNSITAGNTGVSYVRLVRSANPRWTLVNKGVNGEPLYNIGDRLIRILKKDPGFDQIVIEAGINDILLPTLEKRGGLYKWAIGRERKHEILPFDDIAKFRNFYTVLLKEVRIHTRAHIVLVNLSRIDEGASPELMRAISSYNEVINSLAAQANYSLADVSDRFDQILGDPAANKSFLCENFWHTSFWDGLRCLFPGSADRLSKKRGLKLTIDGVHLNSTGAQLYAETVAETLARPVQVASAREFTEI